MTGFTFAHGTVADMTSPTSVPAHPLALGARAVGQQSWVTGGGSYPWPLHQWADVRVQPNPASPDVVSMLADAQAHHRWHPLGDGYRPRPGDWVLFDGHVEVVTRYS